MKGIHLKLNTNQQKYFDHLYYDGYSYCYLFKDKYNNKVSYDVAYLVITNLYKSNNVTENKLNHIADDIIKIINILVDNM